MGALDILFSSLWRSILIQFFITSILGALCVLCSYATYGVLVCGGVGHGPMTHLNGTSTRSFDTTNSRRTRAGAISGCHGKSFVLALIASIPAQCLTHLTRQHVHRGQN